MSNSDSSNVSEVDLIHRIVEIYENERFQLTQLDFSAKGLLPSDRSYLSTRDGKYGWSNYEEVNDQLISRDLSLPATDANGWGYAANFSSIEDGTSDIRSLTHFVRRRRLTRSQIFLGRKLPNETCSYCDSEKIAEISSNLLHAMTKASLYENPGPTVSPIVTNRLKTMMVDILGLGTKKENLTMADVDNILKRFVTTVVNSKSMWSKAVSSVFSEESSLEHIPLRVADLTRDLFRDAETRALAAILIRKYDLDYTYHCNVQDCAAESTSGETKCPFSPSECSNHGCRVVVSLKYAPRHDAVCPFKLISCSRNCGEQVPRQALDRHLACTCGLRPQTCPFVAMGCLAEEIPHRDLEKHLETCVQSHLMLTMIRVSEQQKVIVDLNKKIIDLQNNVKRHDSGIQSLETKTAGVMVAIKHVERETETLPARAAGQVERTLAKELQQVSGEVGKLKSTVGSLERSSSSQQMRLDVLASNKVPSDSTASREDK